MKSWLAAVVLVLAVIVPGLHASRYTINNVVHPSCTGSVVTVDGATATFNRGDDSNLCTGHLKFSGKFMCADASTAKATRAMAQRACYTLGVNMWRPSNFATYQTNQIMLTACDAYEETSGRRTVGSSSSIEIAGVEGDYLPDKECGSPSSNDFCFDQCYDGSGGIDTTSSALENTCTSGDYYFAITCTDYDECETGVRTNCTGPFGDDGHCMRRAACGKNTKCVNEKPGWKCECDVGFEPARGDALYDPYYYGCVDIDECLDPTICGTHGQCINKKGTYDCACIHPNLYDHATKTCLPASCRAPPHITHASLASHYPAGNYKYGDKIEYRCDLGYLAINSSYYNYDYYNNHYRNYLNHFFLTCDETGHWSPYNTPHCEPLTCGDPGYITYADRHVVNYHQGSVCKYTCQKGYRPYGYSTAAASDYFTRTCKDNGYWDNDGLKCVDIDECKEQPGICGGYAKYCINTAGSYMCSCVSWYQSDPSDTHCIDWKAEVPSLKPCDLIDNLNLCVHGHCYDEANKGHCKCDPGWAGSACDVRDTEATLIIACVALALIIIVIIIIFMVFCCCGQHEGGNCWQARTTVVKQVETSAYASGAVAAQPAYGLAYAPRRFY